MNEFKNDPPEKLRAAWDALHLAVRQFNSKTTIDARCPFCDDVLGVEGIPTDSPTQWLVHCTCGKCNTTLKGL